jgi:hypothetical protein
MDEQLRDVNLGELIGLPADKNVLANRLQIARRGLPAQAIRLIAGYASNPRSKLINWAMLW